MALYQGSNRVSSQINIAQYADATDLMKHMTIELGDIGQVMLPLNENENKRRYLNGQAILQEQFPRFTAKLKQAVALYPSLACTEQQWQAKRLADPDDQCAKFVIDDVAGTIRLPRVKFLCGNLNLYKLAEGIPNRRVIQKKLPTSTDRSWYVIYNDGYCEQGNNTMNIAEENHWFAFEIPFITTPHVIIGRERDARNSVGTNTDFMGRWDCSNTGFRTWGNWNGFRMSYTASGMIDLRLIKNYAKTEAENDYQFPYYIQVSTGVDYEVDVTNHITSNSPYSLGMYTRSIGNLNNASWLKSDGNYYSGTAYSDMYNWILQNYNGTRNDGIEVYLLDNSYQWYQDINTNFKIWTARRNPQIGDAVYGYGWYNDNTSDVAGFVTSITDDDHFSYFNVKTQSTVNLIYESITSTNRAMTDYQYVLNTTNQTFRLPLLVGDEMVPNYGSTSFDVGHMPDYIRSDNNAHYFIAPYNCIMNINIHRDGSGGNTPQYSINNIQYGWEPYWVGNYTNWCFPMRKNDVLRIWTDLADNKFKYQLKRCTKCTNTINSLYFYAGETLQDANLINIGRIVENIANIDQLAQMGSQLSALTTRYVVEKWESGNQFRILYNDGWCEQGGEVYLSGEVNVTVTYNVPYVDNNYNLTLGWNSVLSGESANNDTSNGSDKKATGFVVYGKTAAGYMSWRACGYVATT